MREESGMNMQTKSEISRIFVLLYFVGIALLVLAFLLLVSPGERTHAAWLDLIVVWIVFSINFPVLSMGRMRVGSFSAKIPALGLLGLCDFFYSCLALALIFCGFSYGLPFRMQLVGQMGLLFLATTVVAIAWWSSAHAAEVAKEEHSTKSGLEDLKATLSRCESELSAKAPDRNRERQFVLTLKEDARYLSPSTNPSAVSYEKQMVALVDDIRLRLDDSLAPSGLAEQFEQCAALMALRKQTFDR
jgi:hypothetical protein